MRRAGSTPSSSGVGPSARKRHQAQAPTIAALSVQSAGLGSTARRPARAAPSATWARSDEFAATPPPMTMVSMPVRSRGPEQLGDEHVDDRGLERRGDVGHRRVRVLADPLHHRGLQTREREVVGLVEHRTRERDRGGIAFGREPVDRADRPDSRGRGTARPCRTPRPRRRRRSVRALGTSRDPPSRRAACARPTRSSVSSGGSSVGSSSSDAYTCASWWLTPTYGRPGRERDRLGRAHADEQRAREPGTVHRGDRVDVARARRPLRPAPPR